MWHSCGLATFADWKARMAPNARAIYDRFEALIASCGEYHVSPAKTRIAFMGRIRFAGITKIGEDGVMCNFALGRRYRRSVFTRFMKSCRVGGRITCGSPIRFSLTIRCSVGSRAVIERWARTD